MNRNTMLACVAIRIDAARIAVTITRRNGDGADGILERLIAGDLGVVYGLARASGEQLIAGEVEEMMLLALGREWMLLGLALDEFDRAWLQGATRAGKDMSDEY